MACLYEDSKGIKLSCKKFDYKLHHPTRKQIWKQVLQVGQGFLVEKREARDRVWAVVI